ncbi:CCR4-NOT transcription complex subunit 1 [Spatholobus suberectus]|nr:CCR4-NOT transcription complex subunit 1 [Spatholobus suberectus]
MMGMKWQSSNFRDELPHTQSSTNAFPLAVFSVGAALDIFQTQIWTWILKGSTLSYMHIANQLRYPNTNTHYFFFIPLYLFEESNQVHLNFWDFFLSLAQSN